MARWLPVLDVTSDAPLLRSEFRAELEGGVRSPDDEPLDEDDDQDDDEDDFDRDELGEDPEED